MRHLIVYKDGTTETVEGSVNLFSDTDSKLLWCSKLSNTTTFINASMVKSITVIPEDEEATLFVDDVAIAKLNLQNYKGEES